MLGLDVFAVLVKADHVDMVVGPMFKLASSKISIVSVLGTLIKHPPYNGFRRILRQRLIAVLDNTDNPGFGCVDLCLGSFKRLCLGRCFAFWIVARTTLSTIRLLAMFRQGTIAQVGLEKSDY